MRGIGCTTVCSERGPDPSVVRDALALRVDPVQIGPALGEVSVLIDDALSSRLELLGRLRTPPVLQVAYEREGNHCAHIHVPGLQERSERYTHLSRQTAAPCRRIRG